MTLSILQAKWQLGAASVITLGKGVAGFSMTSLGMSLPRHSSTAIRSISNSALGACLILAASRAVAQVVGGQVIDSGAQLLAHVGLRLVDSLNVAVDSTVADSSGTFYLTAPRPGL